MTLRRTSRLPVQLGNDQEDHLEFTVVKTKVVDQDQQLESEFRRLIGGHLLKSVKLNPTARQNDTISHTDEGNIRSHMLLLEQALSMLDVNRQLAILVLRYIEPTKVKMKQMMELKGLAMRSPLFQAYSNIEDQDLRDIMLNGLMVVASTAAITEAMPPEWKEFELTTMKGYKAKLLKFARIIGNTVIDMKRIDATLRESRQKLFLICDYIANQLVQLKDQLLGKGSYGEVYRWHHEWVDDSFQVTNTPDDASYVIKFMKTEDVLPQEVRNEISILRQLVGMGITADYIHSWDCNDRIYVMMNRINGMDLHSYMNEGDLSRVDRLTADDWDMIASTLHKLHKQGILHHDAHPGNFMLQLDPLEKTINRVFIIDFGRARRVEERHKDGLTELFARDYDYLEQFSVDAAWEVKTKEMIRAAIKKYRQLDAAL